MDRLSSKILELRQFFFGGWNWNLGIFSSGHSGTWTFFFELGDCLKVPKFWNLDIFFDGSSKFQNFGT